MLALRLGVSLLRVRGSPESEALRRSSLCSEHVTVCGLRVFHSELSCPPRRRLAAPQQRPPARSTARARACDPSAAAAATTAAAAGPARPASPPASACCGTGRLPLRQPHRQFRTESAPLSDDDNCAASASAGLGHPSPGPGPPAARVCHRRCTVELKRAPGRGSAFKA